MSDTKTPERVGNTPTKRSAVTLKKSKTKLFHATTLILLKSSVFNADSKSLVNKVSLNIIHVSITNKFLFRSVTAEIKLIMVNLKLLLSKRHKNLLKNRKWRKNLLLPLDKATKPRGAADQGL